MRIKSSIIILQSARRKFKEKMFYGYESTFFTYLIKKGVQENSFC